MSHFGIPGVGGSLGKCALCGENFMFEILLGKSVASFTLPGVEQTLYGHDNCMTEYEGKMATDLPAASPIRQAYERQHQPERADP